MKDALHYGRAACDTMMKTFSADALPPVGKFHYHQGVFLSGMLHIYEVCGEEAYFDYVKAWVDSIIYPDGSIHSFDKSMLDDIQPGILLFPLYKRTGDERYKIALKTLTDVLRHWKRNKAGGFWHKEHHQNQMWLDSLYMGGPIQAEYAGFSDEPQFLETAIEQALLMYDHMKDSASGLMFHAWDESKVKEWADPVTGCSSEVWGRAFGWYVVAMLDILEFVPENHPKRQQMIQIEQTLLARLADYQAADGRWYQVVPKPEGEGNWLENSCSALFAYAFAKAEHMGLVEKRYRAAAEKALEGICNTLTYDAEGKLELGGVCIGTDVMDYQGYIERPTSINDLHGMGAFLLMCAELSK